VELTERCNNACIHCYINHPPHDGASKSRELECSELCEILREAAGLGALSVRFTGGEPLLREDFADIYLTARRMGFVVVVSTNARLITDDLADLFEKIPPLSPIIVTAYGAGAGSYESVTRSVGAYGQMLRGVERLMKRGVPFVVDGVWLPETREEVASLESWAAHLGSQTLPTWVVYLHRRGRRDGSQRSEEIAALRPSPSEVSDFLDGKLRERSDDVIGSVIRLMAPRGTSLFLCGVGRSLSLDAYGTLQPCLQLRHPKVVYDLREGTLQEAVTEFFPSIRRLAARNPDYVRRCARCFLGGLCEQCPGWSWTEHGTLDTPVEYLCECAHARARDLGFLKEGERAWEVADWKARVDRNERD
jgi:radical SAM protein with 4Fe4S-binding SPASM domain